FEEGKIDLDLDALVNEFVVLRAGRSRSGLARVVEEGPPLVVERVPTHVRAFGIEPKNLAQTVALHHLLDPDIPAVSIMGNAGSGKTFLALAAALEQVLEQQRYRRGSGCRPRVAGGRRGVGALPRGLIEEHAPRMAGHDDRRY